MENLGLNELREKFLSFFESKDHFRLKSASLMPDNDKSLLLINSGMAPLKPYFTGQKVPPSKRVTTCQKCIRTPDIENVGKTSRHGTFFEMLGNFSFGDYFKKESIAWGWEFITKVIDMPVEKIWVTVYEEDDEAYDIWKNDIGFPEEKIVRLGKADNFWEIGVGPCGPCSEIHYDRGIEHGCDKPDCKPGCDCDRFIEFWNHVFTQFDRDEDGNYNKLANPNIDTGMGLERLAVIVQGAENIFEVDTIRKELDYICELAGVTYGKDPKADISIRVITDHVRSTTFMTSDGIMPSNEGRGYVLRRLLRRAVRHGKLLGMNEPFMKKVAELVIDINKTSYPEMTEKKDYILSIIDVEEIRFNETIDKGLGRLQLHVDNMKKEGQKTLSGAAAFELHDTFGFPLDLTKDILEEEGLTVDEAAYTVEMKNQKERARAARLDSNIESWKEDVYAKIDWSIKTEFVGYTKLNSEAKITAIIADGEIAGGLEKGSYGELILDVTPFYAESGGQTGDTGVIRGKDFVFEVKNTKKVAGDRFAHSGIVVEGRVITGAEGLAEVDEKRRNAIRRNHSTTHLLHKALRTVLGTHVEQAGSLVDEDKLRFDFSHFKAMTQEEKLEVERQVNEAILAGHSIETHVTGMEEARKLGAMALFGEKYGDSVRVVKMGDYSIELCGGTHLTNTSQAGLFKMLSENGVAAGVRRIEAVTGENAYNLFLEKEMLITEVCDKLKATPGECVKRAEHLVSQVKELEKEIHMMKSKMAAGSIDELMSKSEVVNGVKVLVERLEGVDGDSLREFGDKLRDKMGNCLILLEVVADGKVTLLAMASKEALEQGAHAGNLIKEAAKVVGGSGGGRPDMAQGGIKDVAKADELIKVAKVIAKEMIK